MEYKETEVKRNIFKIFTKKKPEYKWNILSYGGTIGETYNKKFITLIDKK